ncbi:DUF397 domain-containing protein [Streptomyces sp. NPDC002599]|uniref:DUF397 domain-containing protein n=1 Tax=Streptomyces sp. NPDC002599 TaxID=3154421 RepID=UPI0033277E7D
MKANAERTAGLTWVKSSYSAGDGGQCVEVAVSGSVVFVRDSKRPDETVLDVSADQWTLFLRMAARG